LLAVDLAERRILAGTNDGGFLSRREALVPLEVFASESISRTDYLYAAIAGALADEPIGPDLPPFALQLIVGATVSDAQHRIPPEGRANDARLRAVIDVLQCGPASKPADVPAARAGELIWLKGRALYLADRKLDAADAFADLVEAWPKHARAEPAMNIAVAIVQNAKELQALSPAAVASRAAFIRVGRLFRKFRPDSAESKRLQYFIARALEDEDRLREAADEYAAVPFDDVNAAHAMLRRVRCLRSLLDSALADERVNQEHKSAIIDETVRAAREGVRAAATRAAGTGESDACLGAEQALVLAGLLNLPVVGRPTDALAALDGFEQHFARCSPAVGQALRERIVALRQLKRLGEARLVVEQYLKTDPEQAGPVMVRLLEAMHAEIGSAAERDDPSTVREIADEAANLARSLLDWSAAREGTISARDRLTIAIWRAAAVLHAGRAEEALGLYDACDEAAGRLGEEHKSQDVEIRLGQAESLLAIGKPADALSLFATLGRVLSEESPAWWRAFAGQLQCHSALEHDPVEILRAIDQRRYFARDLGGVRIRRVLDAIEKTNRSRLPLSAPGP